MPDYKRIPRRWLIEAPNDRNLADKLTAEELSELSQEVIRTYDLDRENRRDWDSQSERALKLAKQVLERKTSPWVGAANVKHPLITVATIQFAARAYPEICKGNRVVKCQITGDDQPKPPQMPPQAALPGAGPGMPPGGEIPVLPGPPAGPVSVAPLPVGGTPSPSPAGPPPQTGTMPPGSPGMEPPMAGPMPSATPTIFKSPKQQRADRIQAHMNFQLTQEMSDWEADMDCLLHVLPVVGQCYKKTYFSSQDGINISELVLPDDCVVSKGRSRDLKKARRITHRLWIYGNEALEKMRSRIWLEVDLGLPPSTDNDTDAPHEFLEQHCWYDLDGDGYKEPYVITVHKQTSETVRVAARWVPENVEFAPGGKVVRIKPDHYFTHYGFIPNPDGSINYLGFGQLLEPINASVNTTLNQLLDAGTLANTGGGFVGRGARLRGGSFSFKPGEWKLVDVQGGALKENLIPLPTREPSGVLFQLLGFLVQAGQEISSVQNVLTGDAQLAANMPVGTMMALVEQGLKVFTGIYKRIYRSLSEEFKKLYKLNARFLDPSVTFYISGHPEQFVERSDYINEDLLVMPVADPELSSDMQRLLKSQALKELTGRPGLNEIEVTRRLVKAVRPENMEELLLTDGQISGREPTPWKPPPQPQQVLAQAKAVRMQQQAQEATVRLQMDLQSFALDMETKLADIALKRANAIKAIADAESKEVGQQIDIYKHQIDQITEAAKMGLEVLKLKAGANASGQGNKGIPGRVPAVEGPSDNPGGV